MQDARGSFRRLKQFRCFGSPDERLLISFGSVMNIY